MKLEQCDENPGRLVPVVNFNRCEAKANCVEVCPYDIFELREITKSERGQLNLVGKLKTFFEKRKAYVTNPAACPACGLCVPACPEKAIKLKKAYESVRNF